MDNSGLILLEKIISPMSNKSRKKIKTIAVILRLHSEYNVHRFELLFIQQPSLVRALLKKKRTTMERLDSSHVLEGDWRNHVSITFKRTNYRCY